MTIYYTTIVRHTHRITTSARSRGGRAAMGAPDHPPAPPAVAEGDALDAPGSAHRHPRRGGRGKVGDAVPDPPQRQHDAGEWDALDVPGSPTSARQP